MSISTLHGTCCPIELWTPAEEVEESARQQLINIASLPWVHHHVAVMPDVHFGKGATVGSVVPMKGAVSPAAVGVDIGCGMAAIRTSLHAHDLPDSLRDLRLAIEGVVPLGMTSHARPAYEGVEETLRGEVNRHFTGFRTLTSEVQKLDQRAMLQVGTLGGGNHFIEICLDEDDAVWLMLHSGSRNIGKSIAEIHIERAKKLGHNAMLPDKDLAVFLARTPEMADYRRDLYWAQEYARLNRAVMLANITQVLRTFFPDIAFDDMVSCHHNYVAEERHFGEDVFVTRKGAIRAGRGELGIIPGSMGTRSYIVRGLGNPDSYESASHGAGRRLSRGAAKRTFTVKDLEAQTVGVECRKDAEVLDEIPGAYKDIDVVMQHQKDLVEIVHALKQVLCVKAGK